MLGELARGHRCRRFADDGDGTDIGSADPGALQRAVQRAQEFGVLAGQFSEPGRLADLAVVGSRVGQGDGCAAATEVAHHDHPMSGQPGIALQ
ncbi:hypothetical protein CRM90_09300 [Mycobacterium sp. ENV421]|nr:hypothetical protein CRM90_09300 [Mycobacterium sp. ENV421]